MLVPALGKHYINIDYYEIAEICNLPVGEVALPRCLLIEVVGSLENKPENSG